jgi:hypothetical protein
MRTLATNGWFEIYPWVGKQSRHNAHPPNPNRILERLSKYRPPPFPSTPNPSTHRSEAWNGSHKPLCHFLTACNLRVLEGKCFLTFLYLLFWLTEAAVWSASDSRTTTAVDCLAVLSASYSRTTTAVDCLAVWSTSYSRTTTAVDCLAVWSTSYSRTLTAADWLAVRGIDWCLLLRKRITELCAYVSPSDPV